MEAPVTAQDLLEAVTITYKTLNDREIKSLQPHEVLQCLSDGDFPEVLRIISDEIAKLEGSTCPSAFDLRTLQGWFDERGYNCPKEIDLSSQQNRGTLLYEALSDLTTVRLEKRQSLVQSLRLPSHTRPASLDRFRATLDRICKGFSIRLDPSPNGAIAALQELAAKDIQPTRSLHLLIPTWTEVLQRQIGSLVTLVQCLNKEYKERRRALLKRLDVTIAAFLWSPKCHGGENEMTVARIIQKSLADRRDLEEREIFLWDVLSADRQVLSHEVTKVSASASKSAVTTVTIGAVPDRGGVPEGYTLQNVYDDVLKANQQLQQKDAREAAALRRSAQDASHGVAGAAPAVTAPRGGFRGRGDRGGYHGGRGSHQAAHQGGSAYHAAGGHDSRRSNYEQSYQGGQYQPREVYSATNEYGQYGGGRGGGGYDFAHQAQPVRPAGGNVWAKATPARGRGRGGGGYDSGGRMFRDQPYDGDGQGGRGGFGGRPQDQPASADWMRQRLPG